MSRSLGTMLRHHRRAAGLTQETLAARAGLSWQAVGTLERGERRFPHRITVTRLADALELSAVERDEFEAAATRPASLRSSPAQVRGLACRRSLPRGIADFTGRVSEIKACRRALVAAPETGPTIIVVEGMAGSGKSALAVHLAHLLADRFPDGQLFLDLQGYTSGYEPVPSAVAVAILLRQLGAAERELPDCPDYRVALWRSELAAMRMLIVIDNALDATQVLPLIPGSPGHLVLVTSRQRLDDLDGAVHILLEPLPRSDAIELLMRLCEYTAGDDPAVAELVELCGYLPLAIRLAATRLRRHASWTTASDFVGRLRDQHQRLAELSAGSRTVAGALDQSYRRLRPRERKVFRLLGLHPATDIEPHVAAALAGLRVDEARHSLERLADAHLLLNHATGRYTFHDLIRVYARATAYGGTTAT